MSGARFPAGAGRAWIRLKPISLPALPLHPALRGSGRNGTDAERSEATHERGAAIQERRARDTVLLSKRIGIVFAQRIWRGVLVWCPPMLLNRAICSLMVKEKLNNFSPRPLTKAGGRGEKLWGGAVGGDKDFGTRSRVVSADAGQDFFPWPGTRDAGRCPEGC